VYRLLAALIIFALAWVLTQANGTVGQAARGGVAYLLNTNYDLAQKLTHLDLSPVVTRVSTLLGLKRGLDVQVEKPIPQGGDTAQQPGLPVSGSLARGFGWQKGSDGWPRFSPGVELAANKGDPVHTVLPGTVSRVLTDPSLGNVVIIEHGGQLASLYGRLDAVGVQAGQQVAQGQVLGTLATNYLHFEVRNGDQLVDPVQYLQQK
jgi:murein DD-endopeptidase MepM/ murein hydrolase activator NlpD